MTIYDIINKADIRTYIADGINPGKTLNFNFFGETIRVTLTHDSEMEDIFLIRGVGIRKFYYEFDKLIRDLEKIFDTLKGETIYG